MAYLMPAYMTVVTALKVPGDISLPQVLAAAAPN
jgi:hypothetical protein